MWGLGGVGTGPNSRTEQNSIFYILFGHILDFFTEAVASSLYAVSTHVHVAVPNAFVREIQCRFRLWIEQAKVNGTQHTHG